MDGRPRNVRVYVRNKSRYNPASKERTFLYVDIANYAGTTIGSIKEDIRRQCKNAVKLDELFLNNQSLADDRSVAHYNLGPGTILESTSNPFLVSCLYIKAAEITQEQEGNPLDDVVQRWTKKSLPKKWTLIKVLLNSDSDQGQPPHFPSVNDFAVYLKRLGKKGANMHPDYTQKDMKQFEKQYNTDFVGNYLDPLAKFMDFHAVRLGYLQPTDAAEPTVGDIQGPGAIYPETGPAIRGGHPVRTGDPTMGDNYDNLTRGQRAVGNVQVARRRKKVDRTCEDCEVTQADVFCPVCPGPAGGQGLCLCRTCSDTLHAGAARRRHDIADISEAPKLDKEYCPRAFLAPFAILLGLYSGLTEHLLSLTEDQIKLRAQPLTDTDLYQKQTGKFVGGFDCMENTLMAKGLVQKEASVEPTYALTERGHRLGEVLHTFYLAVTNLLTSAGVPSAASFGMVTRSPIITNRKICLLIDEKERDKDRLLRFAADRQIDAQTRFLPSGDYIWILTPPMIDPSMPYTGNDSSAEEVLPFIVERKSWEDFEYSINSSRFQRQVNNMLGSGLQRCFYLLEGSVSSIRSNPSPQQQRKLKGLVEDLMLKDGFHINFTSSWMKSAKWLLWMTSMIVDGHRQGLFKDEIISYQEYASRVARQQGAAVANNRFKMATKVGLKWAAEEFIDLIFRYGENSTQMVKNAQNLTGFPAGHHSDLRTKGLILIQNLETYNKKRQSLLNKCVFAVHATPARLQEHIEDILGSAVQNMVHYDVASYWQLYIQVVGGVYVLRTETVEDTDRVLAQFISRVQDIPEVFTPCSCPVPNLPTRNMKSPIKRTRGKKGNNSTPSLQKGHNSEAVGTSKTEQTPTFTGIGYTLGSDDRVNYQMLESVSQGGTDMENQTLNEIEPNLSILEPVVMETETDLQAGDFIDSQNEADVLQQVIAQSAVEAGIVYREKSDDIAPHLSTTGQNDISLTPAAELNEDQQLQMVMEKSREEERARTRDIRKRNYLDCNSNSQSGSFIENGASEDKKRRCEGVRSGSELRMETEGTQMVNPSTAPEGRVELNKRQSEKEMLEIALKLSMKESYRSSEGISQCSASLVKWQGSFCGVDVGGRHTSQTVPETRLKDVEIDPSIGDISNMTDEETLLQIAIERSKVQSYSPRKPCRDRMESGRSSCPERIRAGRLRSDTGQEDIATVQGETDHIVEVITLDDSQGSQDIAEGEVGFNQRELNSKANQTEKEITVIEIDSQDSQRQEIDSQDSQRQEIDSQGSHRQEIDSQDSQRQVIDSQDSQRQEIDSQDSQRQEIDSQDSHRQDIDSQDSHRQEIDSQDSHRQEIDSQDSHRQEIDSQDSHREKIDSQDNQTEDFVDFEIRTAPLRGQIPEKSPNFEIDLEGATQSDEVNKESQNREEDRDVSQLQHVDKEGESQNFDDENQMSCKHLQNLNQNLDEEVELEAQIVVEMKSQQTSDVGHAEVVERASVKSLVTCENGQVCQMSRGSSKPDKSYQEDVEQSQSSRNGACVALKVDPLKQDSVDEEESDDNDDGDDDNDVNGDEDCILPSPQKFTGLNVSLVLGLTPSPKLSQNILSRSTLTPNIPSQSQSLSLSGCSQTLVPSTKGPSLKDCLFPLSDSDSESDGSAENDEGTFVGKSTNNENLQLYGSQFTDTVTTPTETATKLFPNALNCFSSAAKCINERFENCESMDSACPVPDKCKTMSEKRRLELLQLSLHVLTSKDVRVLQENCQAAITQNTGHSTVGHRGHTMKSDCVSDTNSTVSLVTMACDRDTSRSQGVVRNTSDSQDLFQDEDSVNSENSVDGVSESSCGDCRTADQVHRVTEPREVTEFQERAVGETTDHIDGEVVKDCDCEDYCADVLDHSVKGDSFQESSLTSGPGLQKSHSIYQDRPDGKKGETSRHHDVSMNSCRTIKSTDISGSKCCGNDRFVDECQDDHSSAIKDECEDSLPLIRLNRTDRYNGSNSAGMKSVIKEPSMNVGHSDPCKKVFDRNSLVAGLVKNEILDDTCVATEEYVNVKKEPKPEMERRSSEAELKSEGDQHNEFCLSDGESNCQEFREVLGYRVEDVRIAPQNDAEIAKALQDLFDRESELQRSRVAREPENLNIATCDPTHPVLSDEEYARQLQAELDSGSVQPVTRQLQAKLDSGSVPPVTKLEEGGLLRKENRMETDSFVVDVVHTEACVDEDEKFARELQEKLDREQGHSNTDKASAIEGHNVIQGHRNIFRNNVKQRDRAASQLEEYRRLQMTRYQRDKMILSTTQTGYPANKRTVSRPSQQTSTVTHPGPRTKVQTPSRTTVQTSTAQTLTRAVVQTPFMPLSKTPLATRGTPRLAQIPTPVRGRGVAALMISSQDTVSQYQSTCGTAYSVDLRPRAAVVSTAENDKLDIKDCKVIVLDDSQEEKNIPDRQATGGHLTLNNQSAADLDGSHGPRGGVTCGNCGLKGHARSSKLCQQFYSAEESARREERQQKIRQRQEDKAKEEVDTISMLTKQKQSIEDIQTNLQQQVTAIQQDLRHRAVELEVQVNTRVRRLEKVAKRKRKK